MADTSNDRLDALAQLEANWDSYNAAPVDPRAIEAVRLLVRSLHIVPTPDGGLQIETHAAGLDIEIELHPDGSFESILCGSSGPSTASPRTGQGGHLDAPRDET